MFVMRESGRHSPTSLRSAAIGSEYSRMSRIRGSMPSRRNTAAMEVRSQGGIMLPTGLVMEHVQKLFFVLQAEVTNSVRVFIQEVVQLAYLNLEIRVSIEGSKMFVRAVLKHEAPINNRWPG